MIIYAPPVRHPRLEAYIIKAIAEELLACHNGMDAHIFW